MIWPIIDFYFNSVSFPKQYFDFFWVCFVCINLLNTGQSHIFTHINCITFLFLFTVTVVYVMFSLVKICDSTCTCINCVTRFVYSLLYKSLFIYRPSQHRAWSQHSYQNKHDAWLFIFVYKLSEIVALILKSKIVVIC